MSLTIDNLVRTAQFNPRDLMPTLTCESKDMDKNGNPIQVTFTQTEPATMRAEISLVAGELLGLGSVDKINFRLKGEYWNCEWDSELKFHLPSIDYVPPQIDYEAPRAVLGLKDGKPYAALEGGRGPTFVNGRGPTIIEGPMVNLGKIHWRATLNSAGDSIGAIIQPVFRIDGTGVHICSGRPFAIGPGLWLPSVSPTVRESNEWWKNIPRDVIMAGATVLESPLGAIVNGAFFGLVNVTGLVDGPELAGACKFK